MRVSHFALAASLLIASTGQAATHSTGAQAVSAGVTAGMQAVVARAAVVPVAALGGAVPAVAAQAAVTAASVSQAVAAVPPSLLPPSLLPPLPKPPLFVNVPKRVARFDVTILEKDGANGEKAPQHVSLSALVGEPVHYYNATKVPYRCETNPEGCYAFEGLQLRLTAANDSVTKSKLTISGGVAVGHIDEITPVTDADGESYDRVTASEQRLDIHARMQVGNEQSFSLPKYQIILKLKSID